jgi:glucose-1-phosphate adenylyltransferase
MWFKHQKIIKKRNFVINSNYICKDNQYNFMMIKMICLILGGGAGSRLYPLTKDRSKPAVPVGGKYRLIDIPLSNCLNSGVRRMFVLTQFNSASLNRHIKNTYQFDAFSKGFVDILAAEQTPNNPNWFQGTADAVRQSLHHFSNQDYDYVLILSGDQLYQMDFEVMAKHHIAQNAELTIAALPVNARDAVDFGIMKLNANGLIDSFIEKPNIDLLPQWQSALSPESAAEGKHYLASMGIYIFNKKTLFDLLEQNPATIDFGKEIIPAAIQNQRIVTAFEYNGYWTDIGNIRSFYEANLELCNDLPRFNLFDEANPICTRTRMLPPAKFFGTQLYQTIVAEGSILHADVIQRAVVGIRSRIGKGTIVRNSIIMGNDFYEKIPLNTQEIPLGIGEKCFIDRAIIDKNCKIGDNVIIVGSEGMENHETDTYCMIDGIAVIKKGVTIPSGTKIGL